MKFFKCHSQKLKDDKVICLQDKFTDIGPDVFSGCAAEYIILADTTKFIRDYAFSGLGRCNIYLPRTIEEIEPLAFENICPDTTFFCVKGSYAEKICLEHGLVLSYDTKAIFDVAEERKKIDEEQRKIAEEKQRQAEEEKNRIEAQRRKEEAEKAEAERKKREAELEEQRRQERLRLKEKMSNIEINMYVYDDSKGEVTNIITYGSLDESGKAHVVNGEVFAHCEYVNGNAVYTFLYKNEYDLLVEEQSRQQQLRLEDEAQRAETERKQRNAELEEQRRQERLRLEEKMSNIEINNIEINMYVYDDSKGEVTNIITYGSLDESGKAHVVNGEVFAHCEYVNGNAVYTFLYKNEYDLLVKEAKMADSAGSSADETIKIYVFDEENGESVKNVKVSEFPANGRSHIENGRVYIANVPDEGGDVRSCFVSKAEYEKIKQSANKQNSSQNIQCPFCKKSLVDIDIFCPYCGKKVRDVKLCDKCGEINGIDDNFCFNCGNRI